VKNILENWGSFLTEMASYARVKKKIDDENMEFVAISAFRAYRSNKENLSHDKQMKTYLTNMGFSYTKTLGGYSEPVVDPETGKPMVKTDPETGEEEELKTDVVEKSIIVTKEPRPDVASPEGAPSLFEVGMILSQAHDQDSFIHGGPNTITNPKTGESEQTMFIAGYSREGDRIREPWAGPWSSFEEATKDDVYWTKVAGVKGKFVEENYKIKLAEAKKMKVESGLDALKRKYYIDRYKAILEN
tara:strand:- start:132 stop:866 length:735 start_codon:yes stop_codon:yes gene_type:complete